MIIRIDAPRRFRGPVALVWPRRGVAVADASSLSRPGSQLETARNVLYIGAVYLYAIGWSYVYFLFKGFGITLYALDIPFHFFFLYSYGVLADHPGWLLGSAASLLGSTALKPPGPRHWVLTGLLVVFLPLFLHLARQTATRDINALRHGQGRSVRFAFKDKQRASRYSADFQYADTSGALTLVTEAKDEYYVFHQPASDSAVLPIGTTFVVPKADVILATIENP